MIRRDRDATVFMWKVRAILAVCAIGSIIGGARGLGWNALIIVFFVVLLVEILDSSGVISKWLAINRKIDRGETRRRTPPE